MYTNIRFFTKKQIPIDPDIVIFGIFIFLSFPFIIFNCFYGSSVNQCSSGIGLLYDLDVFLYTSAGIMVFEFFSLVVLHFYKKFIGSIILLIAGLFFTAFYISEASGFSKETLYYNCSSNTSNYIIVSTVCAIVLNCFYVIVLFSRTYSSIKKSGEHIHLIQNEVTSSTI